MSELSDWRKAINAKSDETEVLNDTRKKPLRDQILKVADDLFYRDGIHVTGIDTIIAKSV